MNNFTVVPCPFSDLEWASSFPGEDDRGVPTQHAPLADVEWGISLPPTGGQAEPPPQPVL